MSSSSFGLVPNPRVYDIAGTDYVEGVTDFNRFNFMLALQQNSPYPRLTLLSAIHSLEVPKGLARIMFTQGWVSETNIKLDTDGSVLDFMLWSLPATTYERNIQGPVFDTVVNYISGSRLIFRTREY